MSSFGGNMSPAGSYNAQIVQANLRGVGSGVSDVNSEGKRVGYSDAVGSDYKKNNPYFPYGDANSKALFEKQNADREARQAAFLKEKKNKQNNTLLNNSLFKTIAKGPGDNTQTWTTGGPAWKTSEQQEELERNKPETILRYPYDGLASDPDLANWIEFTMYETSGYGLNSQQDSLNDTPTDPTKGKLFGFDYGGLLGKEGVLGKAGQAAEKLATFTQTPAGAVATGIAGGLLLGGDASQILFSGTAAKLGKSVINNFGYPTKFVVNQQTGMQEIQKPGTGDFGFVQEVTGFTTANRKVNKVIALYMPSSLKTSYGVEYTEEDFSQLTEVASAKSIANTAINLVNRSGSSVEDVVVARGFNELGARRALEAVNKTISSAVGTVKPGIEDLKLGKYYEGTSRQVQNPFVVNMYKNTKRRSFEFTFKFTPRSRNEMLTVYQILHTFKKYALPKRVDDLGGRLLEYPAEFAIKFKHVDIENTFLPKIGRCALKDINIIYGDEPFNTFFPDPSGLGAAPTKIELSLTFEELEILTQERINQGY